MGRYILAATGLAVTIGCAVFVWPTPYRELPVDFSRWSDGGVSAIDVPLAARENRFTGSVQILIFGRGWLDMTASVPARASHASVADSLASLARRYGGRR